MDVRYSTRVRMGMAFLALMILTSALRQLSSTVTFLATLPSADSVAHYEKRFAEVKHFLPPGQIVSYTDEFAKDSRQCNGFVLAQYSLAPVVLAVQDSPCGFIKESDVVTAHRSGLLLENFHDHRQEPYLVKLFPNTYFQPPGHAITSTGGQLSVANEDARLYDSGFGLRLYTLRNK